MRIVSFLVACLVWFQVHTAEAQSPAEWNPITLQPAPVTVSPYYHPSTTDPVPGTGRTTACQPCAPAGGFNYGNPRTSGYRPLWPVVTMPPNYYFGRGILGQPKVYVPGQPIRNVLRYLTL